MPSDLREHDILRLRDRMIERRPGLRDSFDRFLQAFEKYTEAFGGDSAVSGARKMRRWHLYRRYEVDSTSAGVEKIFESAIASLTV